MALPVEITPLGQTLSPDLIVSPSRTMASPRAILSSAMAEPLSLRLIMHPRFLWGEESVTADGTGHGRHKPEPHIDAEHFAKLYLLSEIMSFVRIGFN